MDAFIAILNVKTILIWLDINQTPLTKYLK